MPNLMTRPSRSGAFAVISWHAPSTDVMRAAVLALALCAALVSPAFGFYLPGVAPQDYARVRAPSPPREGPQIVHFPGRQRAGDSSDRFSSHALVFPPPPLPNRGSDDDM